MDITRFIKIEMVKHGIDSNIELAKKCNWAPANFNDRLKRNSWKVDDLEKIAKAMNCELFVEFRDLPQE